MELNRKQIALVVENNAYVTMKDYLLENSDEDLLKDVKDFIVELMKCIPEDEIDQFRSDLINWKYIIEELIND
jgi:hypothetical protein